MGHDTIGRVKINGLPGLALLDTGATINTISPKYVLRHGLTVGPLSNILPAGHSGDMDGIAGVRTQAMGYVLIQLEVEGVAGYQENIIAFVFMWNSPFEEWVPLLLGTPSRDPIIEALKESEINKLAVPWARAQ